MADRTYQIVYKVDDSQATQAFARISAELIKINAQADQLKVKLADLFKPV